MKRIPYAKPLAIALAAFAIYALLGFFAAPPLVKRAIVNTAADTLLRKASVGEVRVNPLLLSLELKDVALTEADGAPIAGFRRLFADFELSSLARFAWTFAAVEIDGLDLRADIAPEGRFNLLALLDSLPKADSSREFSLPRVLLRRFVLSGGAISFSDRSLAEPASAKLAPLDLEVRDISTLPDRRGDYTIRAKLADGASISWRGEISLQPLASKGEIALNGIKLASPWRFLHERAGTAEPKGELDFSARYRFAYAAGAVQFAAEEFKADGRGIALAVGGAEKGVALTLASLAAGGRAELSAERGKPWKAGLDAFKFAATGLEFTDRSRATPYQVATKEVTAGFSAKAEERNVGPQAVLDGIAVTLSGIAAGEAGAARPLGELDTVAVEGARLDLAERRLGAGRVAVGGGELRVVREKDGSLLLLKILAPSDEGLLRREIGGLVKDAKSEGKPWSIAADEIAVNGTRLSLADHSFGAPVAYDTRDLRFVIHGFASDSKAPVKFDAALRLEQGGSVNASGTALLSGEQAEVRAKLERISLRPLQPAAATRVQATLASGDVSADVRVSYRRRDGKHGLRLAGTLRVDDFLANEAQSGERLLAWKSLSATGLSLGFQPDQLKIEEAKVEGLGAKIVVFQDRSVNLLKAVTLRTDDATGKATATIGDAKPLFPVTIDRVRFADGIVDFTDQSLVLPFGAKVHQANGLLEGVSTDRASRATVRLEGRVDEYGLARAEGSLEPFHPTDFMDLTVIFRNVEMPALSPYSATFAGRRIASGKLSLDLKYRIDKGQLAGDNRVVLEKFTLGERVESPGAINLPLDFAIALLTDSNGKIDLAMPVSGDVGNPKFNYGSLVWQAISTVISNIVSAPFRALFGGSGEKLEKISFDPGRAALLPPEQEKLKHVAEGLAKRPQMRVVAEGQTGPADRAALQQQEVARTISARLGRAPAAGAAPDPVNVGDAKTQRALEALFAERQSEDALAKFAADTARSRNKEVDRVNAAMALIGRASADRAFYEALLKRLNEAAPVADTALAQLAAERASAVTGHLTTALAVPAERATSRAAQSPGEAQVKLELNAAP